MSSTEEQLGLTAREDDYEISVPAYWKKQQQPDGTWALVSTKSPETLTVHVLVPDSGRVNDPQKAAETTAASVAKQTQMTPDTNVRAEWVGKAYSITGTGASVPHQTLFAYRVLCDDKRIVWALWELPVGATAPVKLDALAADAAMDKHRRAILASLKLR